MSSSLIYTIWAVFGGFILHFLLCNYITVLLGPSYEEPVETAADLIKRDITPFIDPGAYIYKQFFAASIDPDYQEISKRLVIAKNWQDYKNMVQKVTSTGKIAQVGTLPPIWIVPAVEQKKWYRSFETIGGFNPYGGHLLNKKWPLKKVFDYYKLSLKLTLLNVDFLEV